MPPPKEGRECKSMGQQAFSVSSKVKHRNSFDWGLVIREDEQKGVFQASSSTSLQSRQIRSSLPKPLARRFACRYRRGSSSF